MKKFFFLSCGIGIFFQLQAMAEELVAPTEVSVETQQDFTANYKERRTSHGALFSINMEKFYPIDYRSLFDDSHIEEIIGEDRFDLIGGEIGYKYNISVLSAAILASYSTGKKVGTFSGTERSISVSKQGVSANIALDGVFAEPWIVPYVQGGAHQFSVSEENPTETKSATTGISMNYRYGLLFQLDWIENGIDKSAEADRLRSSGLENTYIDIYFAEYLASADAIDPSLPFGTLGDPNMLSGGEMGIGLKLEF